MDEILKLFRAYDQLYQTLAFESGMPHSAFAVMTSVACNSECTQADIAHEWALSKQSVHSGVKWLEANGYVELQKGEKGPGKRIVLTAKGRSYAEEHVEPVLRADALSWESLPDDARALCEDTLRTHLSRFMQQLAGIRSKNRADSSEKGRPQPQP